MIVCTPPSRLREVGTVRRPQTLDDSRSFRGIPLRDKVAVEGWGNIMVIVLSSELRYRRVITAELDTIIRTTSS